MKTAWKKHLLPIHFYRLVSLTFRLLSGSVFHTIVQTYFTGYTSKLYTCTHSYVLLSRDTYLGSLSIPFARVDMDRKAFWAAGFLHATLGLLLPDLDIGIRRGLCCSTSCPTSTSCCCSNIYLCQLTNYEERKKLNSIFNTYGSKISVKSS